MNREVSIKKIEDKIFEMIYRAETFLRWTQDFFILYEEGGKENSQDALKLNEFYSSPNTMCIVLHHILYFQEATLILNTLLEKKRGSREPTEISFSFYLSKVKIEEFEEKINKVINKYDKSNLRLIRNRIFAHKQFDSSGDPITGFLNPVKKEIVAEAYSTINELKYLTIKYFSHSSNNYFKDFYNPAFNVIYKTLESNMNRVN